MHSTICTVLHNNLCKQTMRNECIIYLGAAYTCDRFPMIQVKIRLPPPSPLHLCCPVSSFSGWLSLSVFLSSTSSSAQGLHQDLQVKRSLSCVPVPALECSMSSVLRCWALRRGKNLIPACDFVEKLLDLILSQFCHWESRTIRDAKTNK